MVFGVLKKGCAVWFNFDGLKCAARLISYFSYPCSELFEKSQKYIQVLGLDECIFSHMFPHVGTPNCKVDNCPLEKLNCYVNDVNC